MAENFNEQELQALFRRHLPYRQMPPEFAERLKQQVLAEVANTLQSSTMAAEVKEEVRYNQLPTATDRPLPTYTRQPAKRQDEAKGGMWGWLQHNLRLAPSLSLAGATLAAVLALVIWGPSLLRQVGFIEPQTGAPQVMPPGQLPGEDTANVPTATTTEGAPSVGIGEIITDTATPTPPSEPTATAIEVPAADNTGNNAGGNNNGGNDNSGNGGGTSIATATAVATAASTTPTVAAAVETNTATPLASTPSKTSVAVTATPTRQGTAAPTRTPDPDNSATPTRSGTATPTRTPDVDNNVTATRTSLPVPTKTSVQGGASGESSPFNTPTPTNTSSSSPVATVLVPTKSPTPAVPTLMPFTLTPTLPPTATLTRQSTPTRTPPSLQPIPTATATPTATDTAVPPTATPTATDTAVPTATDTAVPPTATPTATDTAVPPTATPTATDTAVPPTPTPTATNQPPVVTERQYEVNQGATLSIPLLNGVADSDSEPLWIVSVAQPANGVVERSAENGDIVSYTPNSQFSGIDSFTFEVTDGTVTVSGKVNITVVNHPPSFVNTATEVSATVVENFELLVNATDSDAGDELTIRVPELSPLPEWLTLERMSNGQSKLSGTPNVVDKYTIKLEVVDRAGALATWEFQLTVAPAIDGNVNGAGVGDSADVTTTTTVTTTVP